jgi:acylphosphatase
VSPVAGEPAAGERLTAWVEGRVQGVGFRWWVRSSALELGLAGYAENLADGRVKVVAEGTEDRCRELLARLEARDGWLGDPGGAASRLGGGSQLARLSRRRPGSVRRVTHRWAGATGEFSGFSER